MLGWTLFVEGLGAFQPFYALAQLFKLETNMHMLLLLVILTTKLI